MAAGDLIKWDSSLYAKDTINDLWMINGNPVYFTGNSIRINIATGLIFECIAALEEFTENTGTSYDTHWSGDLRDVYANTISADADYTGSWRFRRISGIGTPDITFFRYKLAGVEGRKLKYFNPQGYAINRTDRYLTAAGAAAGSKIMWDYHWDKILTPK